SPAVPFYFHESEIDTVPMVSGRIPVINPFEPSSDDSDINLNVDETGVGGEDATHPSDSSQQQTDHLDQSDQSIQSSQSSQSLQSLQQSPPVTPEHRLDHRRQQF
ncbi:hypothetical protein LPJ56_004328, partial [Coemansia sp. RSA 2599]